MMFLAGGPPESARTWLSHVNAPAPNRDTHVHIYLQFPACRSLGSASKTVHGANHLDVSVLGSERSVHWSFNNPDQLRVGRGNQVTCLHRSAGRYGSQQPPYHGTGWLEGYNRGLALLPATPGRARRPGAPYADRGARRGWKCCSPPSRCSRLHGWAETGYAHHSAISCPLRLGLLCKPFLQCLAEFITYVRLLAGIQVIVAEFTP